MTTLTKAEAHEETLKRWRGLPTGERQTYRQARVFAAALAAQLDFRTMANSRKLIEAWLVRELDAPPPSPASDEAGVNEGLTP